MTEKEFNEIKQEFKTFLLDRVKFHWSLAKFWWRQACGPDPEGKKDTYMQWTHDQDVMIWEILNLMMEAGLINSAWDQYQELKKEQGLIYGISKEEEENNEHNSSDQSTDDD